jgi:hypothetical protein
MDVASSPNSCGEFANTLLVDTVGEFANTLLPK